MKAIVLAGGFAKRLWPLTMDTPKPLLPVAGKPMIEYILEKISCIDEIEKIFISTNSKFESHFNEWASNFSNGKKIEVFADKSTEEENKLGAIGALSHLLAENDIDDDLLVVAGDNLFEFDMKDFLSEHDGSPIVALYDMVHEDAVRHKYGVVMLDDSGSIKHFQEKPENPMSTLISTGCYFFPKRVVNMVHDYIGQGNNPDAPGFFISWLSQQVGVKGFVFGQDKRWFDIGSIESYNRANEIYSSKD